MKARRARIGEEWFDRTNPMLGAIMCVKDRRKAPDRTEKESAVDISAELSVKDTGVKANRILA